MSQLCSVALFTIMLFMSLPAVSHWRHPVFGLSVRKREHLCFCDHRAYTKCLLTRYLLNCLWEFHQIYYFGAFVNKAELITFWGQRSRSHQCHMQFSGGGIPINGPACGRGTPYPPCPFTFPSFAPFYFFFVGFNYFLLLSIPSLSTRIVPLRFQAGGRRPNLGLVCCVYFVLSVFLS